MRLKSRLLLGLLLVNFLAPWAGAQEKYPVKPINFSVPLPPGATVDIIARLYGDKLSQRVGQPVTVSNRTGAGGVIASDFVVKASPDGYALLFGNSQHSINAALLPKMPYDPMRDFVGVAMVAEAPSLVVVNPDLGVRTLRDFIALAKKQPGSINYGAGAAGTSTHLAGADFAHFAGIQLTHVPYGGGNIIPDLLSNRIQAMFVPVAFLLSQVKEGKLIALAISSPEPLRNPIGVPSAHEAGLPGYAYSAWYGMLASAKTPPPVLARLGSEMQQISDDAEVREKLQIQGIIPRKMALQEFDAFIRADVARISALIKASGIKAQ